MKNLWGNASLITKIIVIAIAVILLFIIYKQLMKLYLAKYHEDILQNSTVQTSVNNTPLSINLGSIAQQIHAAFHDYYYGLSEDEETAIVALNNVPKSLIPQLSDTYFKLYAVNLNSEFTNYLSSEDYKRVQNLFS